MKKYIKKSWLAFSLLLLLAAFVIYKLCVLDIIWEVNESEADAWKESSVPSNTVLKSQGQGLRLVL